MWNLGVLTSPHMVSIHGRAGLKVEAVWNRLIHVSLIVEISSRFLGSDVFTFVSHL